MLLFYQFHDLAVDFLLRIRCAGQRGIAAQILVLYCLHGDHIKFIAHAVPGDHSAGQLGSLFNIVGGACGDLPKGDFFGGASTGIGGDFVLYFFLGQQIFIPCIHLHGIAQCPGGAGNDRDFLYGGGVALHGCHKGVADLMVRDHFFLLVGKYGVLFLITGDDHLDAFLQVGFIDDGAAVAHCPQCRLVDHVRQFCTGSAGRHTGDGMEIHVFRRFDFPGMYLQNGLAAL